MNTKEKIYIAVIVLLIILLIVTNLEIQKVPERKPRTEEHIQNCEIWKICDYRKNLWGCPGIATECPEVYDCWEEERDCDPINIPSGLFENKTQDFVNDTYQWNVSVWVSTEKEYDLTFEQIPEGEIYCLYGRNYSQHCKWYKGNDNKFRGNCYSCSTSFEECYNKTLLDDDKLISSRITAILC